MDDNIEALADQVDVIFTATPQGFLASVINENILGKTKIVDLSADFRIKDVKVYENGMVSSTRVRNLLKKLFMDFAK